MNFGLALLTLAGCIIYDNRHEANVSQNLTEEERNKKERINHAANAVVETIPAAHHAVADLVMRQEPDTDCSRHTVARDLEGRLFFQNCIAANPDFDRVTCSGLSFDCSSLAVTYHYSFVEEASVGNGGYESSYSTPIEPSEALNASVRLLCECSSELVTAN